MKEGFAMNVTREQLHLLVDMVDSHEMGLVFQLLTKFIPEEDPLPDEMEALHLLDQQISNDDLYDASAINWDR